MHLVAIGMKQIEGTDYSLTFSSIVKTNSIRLVLTSVVTKNWEMRRIDISNAFLHGKLKERIVVSHFKGFEVPSHPNHVCLLHRSLYGHK